MYMPFHLWIITHNDYCAHQSLHDVVLSQCFNELTVNEISTSGVPSDVKLTSISGADGKSVGTVERQVYIYWQYHMGTVENKPLMVMEAVPLK